MKFECPRENLSESESKVYSEYQVGNFFYSIRVVKDKTYTVNSEVLRNTMDRKRRGMVRSQVVITTTLKFFFLTI